MQELMGRSKQMQAVVWRLMGVPLGILFGGPSLNAFDYHAIVKIFRHAALHA